MADETFEIDLDNLKVREIEEIEEIIGEPIDLAFADGKPRGKVLRAIGFVVKRRTNPAFTIEDAGELVIRLGEPADPTSAATG